MEKLENWKIAKLMREMWRQSEQRLFQSIFKKASRNGIVKNRRCWHMWKKNKNKTSNGFDDITGKELPWRAVRKARDSELKYLRDLGSV